MLCSQVNVVIFTFVYFFDRSKPSCASAFVLTSKHRFVKFVCLGFELASGSAFRSDNNYLPKVVYCKTINVGDCYIWRF